MPAMWEVKKRSLTGTWMNAKPWWAPPTSWARATTDSRLKCCGRGAFKGSACWRNLLAACVCAPAPTRLLARWSTRAGRRGTRTTHPLQISDTQSDTTLRTLTVWHSVLSQCTPAKVLLLQSSSCSTKNSVAIMLLFRNVRGQGHMCSCVACSCVLAAEAPEKHEVTRWKGCNSHSPSPLGGRAG
jgi:hypothetical protein